MNLQIAGKNVIHEYHHYIMRLELKEFRKIDVLMYYCRKATLSDLDILKQGDFDVANMIPYLKRLKTYATGYIFFELSRNTPVGYIWVVRRGGNEMSYRIRNSDALISCVSVFKPFRGNNIANLMIGKIVSVLQSEGCHEVKLAVRTDNSVAIRCYLKCGFSIIGEKKYIRILRHNFPYQII